MISWCRRARLAAGSFQISNDPRDRELSEDDLIDTAAEKVFVPFELFRCAELAGIKAHVSAHPDAVAGFVDVGAHFVKRAAEICSRRPST